MALKQMESLATEARARFSVRGVSIVHRLGRLEIGQTSVLIVVASAHRSPAFEACRWIIDTLKKTVPIWKKEYFEDGQTWVEREVVSAVYLDHEEVLVTDERQVTGDDTWSYSITTECG